MRFLNIFEYFKPEEYLPCVKYRICQWNFLGHCFQSKTCQTQIFFDFKNWPRDLLPCRLGLGLSLPFMCLGHLNGCRWWCSTKLTYIL